MNPDKCQGCHQLCDPLDPEYCIWQGQRWHVTCALKQVNDDIGTIIEKQVRHDTTAANYSDMQSRIDSKMDEREGLLKILRGVPEQTHQLGLLFIKGSTLVKRGSDGHLLDTATDPSTLLRLPDAERCQIEPYSEGD